ncbi:hypothetical protein [Vibrio sp. 1CM23M]|uniref:hypothetical protein n=1 Tax=Vibrio sp. 1CM23M TaxID=2929164 RepID=UPI0020C0C38A|nr:hypothetical protein [Vibrio sp. 1CM23M]MCK8073708.1 hypothetical protein [Vibrio sp. 1CM23M]
MIAIAISLVYILLVNKINVLLKIVFHKNTIFYVSLVSLPFLYYLLITVYFGEMDFTYLTQYKRLLFYFGGAAIVSVFIASLIDFDNYQLVKLFRAVVVIQLVIMLAAFFFPAFRDVIALTKPDHLVAVASSYGGGGVRGLSLSGPQFFGLSVILSFILFLLVLEEYNTKNRSYIYVLYAMMLLFFMSAGRVVLVAGFVFFVYLIFQNSRKSYYLVLRLLVLFIIAITIMITMYFYIFPESIKLRVDNFTRFSFEFIYNYIDNGKLETSSTNHLFTMYFPISLETFLFGDGRYSDPTTRYYMDTDSGYMRQVLASGFMSFFVFFFSTIYMLYYCVRDISMRNSDGFIGIMLSSVLLLAIFHYKGEVFGYFLNLHMILWVFYFVYRCKKENEY